MENILHKRLISVATTIKDTRLTRNYSQDYLAARLCISQNAYSKLELGYTRLTLERLLRIADILEIDSAKLLA